MRADLSSEIGVESATCLPAPVAVTVRPGTPVTRICPLGPTWKYPVSSRFLWRDLLYAAADAPPAVSMDTTTRLAPSLVTWTVGAAAKADATAQTMNAQAN